MAADKEDISAEMVATEDRFNGTPRTIDASGETLW
jgi:hypothetical protein